MASISSLLVPGILSRGSAGRDLNYKKHLHEAAGAPNT